MVIKAQNVSDHLSKTYKTTFLSLRRDGQKFVIGVACYFNKLHREAGNAEFDILLIYLKRELFKKSTNHFTYQKTKTFMFDAFQAL